MAKIDPVRSSHDYEEIDPKYHNDNDCPHCHELVRNHHVAEGKGGHPLCDWCASH
jgi:formylmethanofuran dehydrogenase subunit E